MIVPVYNARQYLMTFLECLDSQTGVEFEVIAVDDGSTDGSGELLDEAAAELDWLTVRHQENSGWAGKLRNVGLDLARGRYVFFADADDEIRSAASLSGMVTFADEHDTDVRLPRM